MKNDLLSIDRGKIHPELKQYLEKEHYSNLFSNAYDICKDYLDKNFLKEFSSEESYHSRLWELWVCHKIVTSQFKDNLVINLGGVNPDFILRGKNFKPVMIECVCPQVNKDYRFSAGDYEYEARKQEDDNNLITSAVISGIDGFIVSRFTSSLKEKAEKFEKYQKQYPDHFRVLCISGLSLSKYKGDEHNEQFLPVSEDFEVAVRGKKKYFFEQGKEGLEIEYYPSTITKPSGCEIRTAEEYLGIYDAIIFNELYHFITILASREHEIYYNSSKEIEELKKILESIFNS